MGVDSCRVSGDGGSSSLLWVGIGCVSKSIYMTQSKKHCTRTIKTIFLERIQHPYKTCISAFPQKVGIKISSCDGLRELGSTLEHHEKKSKDPKAEKI